MNKIFLMKRFFFATGFLLVSLLMSAQTKKHLVFSPQWHAQAQFAGYIVAYNRGFYSDEGLNLEIKYPKETKSSLDLMREGKADLITTVVSDAIILKSNQNLDIVNVLQTSQHSSLCLVKKPGNGKALPNTFRNMRVGIWASGMASSATAMNIIQHLNWRVIPFREGLNLMNYDMVDAITAMDYNELLRMKYSGWDVSERSVLHFSENGYDIPEDGVYCERAFYEENKEAVDAFVRASKRGWEWCREHPEEAIEYVYREMHNNYIYSSKVIQRASLQLILQKQESVPGTIPYTLSAKQFQEAINTLRAANLITADVDYQTFIAK